MTHHVFATFSRSIAVGPELSAGPWNEDFVFLLLGCAFFLSYGYGIWPRRAIPCAGPDKKGRSLKVTGYLLLVYSAFRLVMYICGFGYW